MYFYDTCALINDQEVAFKEPFVIADVTLYELEDIKTSKTKDEELKVRVRKLLHLLDEHQDMYTIFSYHPDYSLLHEYYDKNDSKIVAAALEYSNKEPIKFRTDDLACAFIARNVNLEVVTKTPQEEAYLGYKKLNFKSEDATAEFYSHMTEGNLYNLEVNQYLLIYVNDVLIDKLRWDGEKYEPVGYPCYESRALGKIKPKDEYQTIAFDSMRHNQLTVLRGPAGTGKAQPNSTRIPTKNGYKLLGDIQIGDCILDRHGKETKVLDVFPQGYKDNYKVTFSDGRVSYCNDEHLWSYITSKGNLKTITLRDMMDQGLQTPSGEWRFKIPISAPVEFNEKQYSIDPYVIGVFLGDGCCQESALTLSSQDEEIVSEVAKLIGAKEYDRCSFHSYNWVFYNKPKTGIKGSPTRILTNDYFEKYKDNIIQLSYNKSIPEEYKYGSIEQRLNLIQGLMDTDGTIDREKGRVHFTSTSFQLIKDLQEICWSLGYLANYSIDNRKEKYTCKQCYTLQISCPKAEKTKLFRLSRKKDIAVTFVNNGKKSVHSDKLTIKSIEKMPNQEEMTCLLVDNQEHLYLTEEYIVTHNSFLAMGFLMDRLEKGAIDKIIVFCNTVATAGAARLGFYPGDKNSKLLDSQIGNFLASKLGGMEGVRNLIDSERLVLLPMSDIRGYDTTGMHAGIYITEAQNMDIELMRLALQRIGEDSICVIEGDDDAQVDMTIYAGARNGMKRLSKIFRGQDFYGEVSLQTIRRSKIAEIAQKM